jgi:hypothetical protein
MIYIKMNEKRKKKKKNSVKLIKERNDRDTTFFYTTLAQLYSYVSFFFFFFPLKKIEAITYYFRPFSIWYFFFLQKNGLFSFIIMIF